MQDAAKSLHQIHGFGVSGDDHPADGEHGQQLAALLPSGVPNSVALPLLHHLPHAAWPAANMLPVSQEEEEEEEEAAEEGVREVLPSGVPVSVTLLLLHRLPHACLACRQLADVVSTRRGEEEEHKGRKKIKKHGSR